MLDALPAEVSGYLSRSLPDNSRVPLPHLVTYMKAARGMLAPEDPQFFREMGRFAGERDRDERAFSHMVADRETALKMLKMLWQAYYASGRFDIVARDEESFTGRAAGYLGDPVLCERITGVAETQLRGSRAEHVACAFRGDPAREWKVWW